MVIFAAKRKRIAKVDMLRSPCGSQTERECSPSGAAKHSASKRLLVVTSWAQSAKLAAVRLLFWPELEDQWTWFDLLSPHDNGYQDLNIIQSKNYVCIQICLLYDILKLAYWETKKAPNHIVND